jgi:hypothetical protein
MGRRTMGKSEIKKGKRKGKRLKFTKYMQKGQQTAKKA